MAVAVVLSLVAAYRQFAESVSAAQQVEHSPTHDDPGDYLWDSDDVTTIVLDGSAITVEGSGSSAWVDDTVSAKGIKGTVAVIVTGGTLVLASGDDGVHADATLEINSGAITIIQSYEGLESAVIVINGGEIDLTSSDDGINVAGGNDGSGMVAGPGRGGPGGGRDQAGAPAGQDAFAVNSNYYLKINGGTVVMNAGGDGLDSMAGWR